MLCDTFKFIFGIFHSLDMNGLMRIFFNITTGCMHISVGHMDEGLQKATYVIQLSCERQKGSYQAY
jgi:hypothetical protein